MSVPWIVKQDRRPGRQRFPGPRVPPNLFAIVLGIAGLALAWYAAGPVLGSSQAVPDALSVLDAGLWLVLVGAYLAEGPRSSWPTSVILFLSPFVSVSALTAISWPPRRQRCLCRRARSGDRVPGRDDSYRGLANRPVDDRGDRAGFRASGLLAADRRGGADRRERRRPGSSSAGRGVVRDRRHQLVLLGSMTFNRLFTRPALPSALVPTMAIDSVYPRSRGRRISPWRAGP